MLKNKITTRQYLMAGIVLAFVMTLILGNYGVYTYINHQRYVIKDELMDDIEDNVKTIGNAIKAQDQQVDFYKKWMEMQLGEGHPHSIIENPRMSQMTYDDDLERTYNMEVVMDKVGLLVLYDGLLRNMPSDLRVELNMLLEGYPNQQFLYSTMTPKSKLILNSSFGYTSIMPYDANIDENTRGQIVDYYEGFNQLSTTSLDQWTVQQVPGNPTTYFGKTVALDGGTSDRYLLTLLQPVKDIEMVLHSVEKDYTLHIIDDQNQLVIKSFKSVASATGESKALTTLFEEAEFVESAMYPFVKKMGDEYVVGHPIKNTGWKVLAVFTEEALGKNTLFRTSGFYFLNLLFIAIFSFLVVMVNRHLAETEK